MCAAWELGMYMLSCLLVCASLVLLLYTHEQNFSVILLCLCLVILFSLCGSFCHLTTSCVCRLHSSNVQTREGIASAISSCKGLTELSGLWDLDEDSMMMLMPIAPRLTKLDLTYASLGETQLSTLISSCTNLIDLKVRNGFHSVLCFQGDKIKFCYCFFSPSFYVPGLWFVNPCLDFQIGLVLPFKLSGKLASLCVKFIQKPLFV